MRLRSLWLMLTTALAAQGCGRDTPPAGDGTALAPPTSTPAVRDAAAPVPRLPRYLRAAGAHTCLVVGGTPYCWGDTSYGALGASGEPCGATARCVHHPAPVPGLGDVVDLALADEHLVALRADGALVALGRDDGGALGLGEGARDTCGDVACATTPRVAASAPSAVSVWAGPGVSCVVATDGSLHCAGAGALSGLAALPDRCRVPHDVPCSRAFTKVRDGVAEVGLGYNQGACALLADGTVSCSGPLTSVLGTLGAGVELAMGQQHVCVRRAGGAVACAGWNAFGQVGTGQVDDPRQLAVEAVRVVEEARWLAAGALHTCAIVRDGELWCWGDNRLGQLGLGREDATVPSPKRIDLPPITNVAAGSGHTCALDVEDRVWCFGGDVFHQLGGAEATGRCEAHPSMEAGPCARAPVEVFVAP